MGTSPLVMFRALISGDLKVTDSGMKIASRIRMIATVDTVTIWVRVDTLPLMIELRKRPISIISQ